MGNKPDQVKMKRKAYERELALLELVKLQTWTQQEGLRVAALPVPTERETTEFYLQRYMAHLPAAGEMVLFDRSWYNRLGVERVMGFCTSEQDEQFARICPEFERGLVDDGIIPIKYGLDISDETQEKRFRSRATSTEAQPHGPRLVEQVDGIFESPRCDARAHRYARSALVHRRHQHQTPHPAQCRRPSPRPDPVRGCRVASADGLPAAAAERRLCRPGHQPPTPRPGPLPVEAGGGRGTGVPQHFGHAGRPHVLNHQQQHRAVNLKISEWTPTCHDARHSPDMTTRSGT